MELKKILPELRKSLSEVGLDEPNELQSETWSAIKSGADCVLISPVGTGKTTTLAMNVIQRLGKPEGESTRALVIVEDKEKVAGTVTLFNSLAEHTGLRIFGVHERGDIDYDKNHISLGMDILIGTPAKINTLFSSAGFNMTTIRMFVVDDADVQFRNRHDATILRLLASIEKTQKVFAASGSTERLEIMIDKSMDDPNYFDFTHS